MMSPEFSLIIFTITSIFIMILFIILRIRLFKITEKEIKQRKNYLSHLDELFNEHIKYLSTLRLAIIALVFSILILIVEVVKYYS